MKLLGLLGLIGNISATLLKGQCVLAGTSGAPHVFKNLDL